MKITYFALQRIKVGDDWREPGDLIPEAGDWHGVRTYVQDGTIAPVLVASLPKKTVEMLQQWEEEQELLAAINAEDGLKLSQEREAAIAAANVTIPNPDAFFLPNGADHSTEVAI